MEVCWSRFRTAFALTLVAAALAVPGRPVLAGPPPEPKSKLASKPALDPELQTALSSAPTAAQWPNSNYAVLLDLGNVNVKSDGTIVAKYRLTYKLFNQRA